jgi:hypothetical protein
LVVSFSNFLATLSASYPIETNFFWFKQMPCFYLLVKSIKNRAMKIKRDHPFFTVVFHYIVDCAIPVSEEQANPLYIRIPVFDDEDEVVDYEWEFRANAFYEILDSGEIIENFKPVETIDLSIDYIDRENSRPTGSWQKSVDALLIKKIVRSTPREISSLLDAQFSYFQENPMDYTEGMFFEYLLALTDTIEATSKMFVQQWIYLQKQSTFSSAGKITRTARRILIIFRYWIMVGMLDKMIFDPRIGGKFLEYITGIGEENLRKQIPHISGKEIKGVHTKKETQELIKDILFVQDFFHSIHFSRADTFIQADLSRMNSVMESYD